MTDDDGHQRSGDGAMRSVSSDLLEDLRVSLMFLTRLPVSASSDEPGRPLSQASRAFPLAGIVVGLLTAAVFIVCLSLGLPAIVSSAIAVGSGVVMTGGLHEDGLADVADGFGGGRTVERKLEIMRDSRIGTFGVVALIIVVLIKVSAIAALVSSDKTWWAIAAAIVAGACLSRSFMAVMMTSLPPARPDGRSVEAGQPASDISRQSLLIGLAVSAGVLWVTWGFWVSVAAIVAAAGVYFIVKRLALRQIGGQTGDVLGCLQILAETSMLATLSAT